MENKQKVYLIGLVLIVLCAMIGGPQFVISALLFVVGSACVFYPQYVEEWIDEYRRDYRSSPK
jgi:hypothetical protein